MEKTSAANKKLLKELNTKLKLLQEELIQAQKLEGKDAYIDIKVNNNQARFDKIKKNNLETTAIGKFYLEIQVTAKNENIFMPISIASGKKTAGFMYQIEGTGEGKIATAEIKVRGEGVSQVTVGTLLYAKIPRGKTAVFEIRAAVRGKYGKEYKIVFTRFNYKIQLSDMRYQQYQKEIHSDSVSLS